VYGHAYDQIPACRQVDLARRFSQGLLQGTPFVGQEGTLMSGTHVLRSLLTVFVSRFHLMARRVPVRIVCLVFLISNRWYNCSSADYH
jgi:hypothetical protein